MSIFTSFCAALAAALIVINVVQTWAVYPQLPDRVPLQFNWNGVPRTYGPRASIWLVVFIQLVVGIGMVFTGYALATHAPGTHGSLTGFVIFTVLFNAMLWRVQRLLISAAKSGGNRVPMSGFLLFCGVCLVLILIDAFAIG